MTRRARAAQRARGAARVARGAVARAAADVPVHMHVAEQPAELEACLAEYGLRPVELLEEVGLLQPRFTAVHAVHLEPHESRMLGDARRERLRVPLHRAQPGRRRRPRRRAAERGRAAVASARTARRTSTCSTRRGSSRSTCGWSRVRRAVLDPGGGAARTGWRRGCFDAPRWRRAEPGPDARARWARHARGLLHRGPEPPLAGGREPARRCWRGWCSARTRRRCGRWRCTGGSWCRTGSTLGRRSRVRGFNALARRLYS